MSGYAHTAMLILAVSIVSACSSCADVDSSITTDMESDFSHHHNNQAAHEHRHDEKLNGTHSHNHEHGHRHKKPPQDGMIVSIGHSKHANKSSNYHAEVLPITNNTIRFNLLIEDETGGYNKLPIKMAQLDAELRTKRNSPVTKLLFNAVEDTQSASAFELSIPPSMKDAETLFVKLPKVKLGNQVHSFNFTISQTHDSHRGN